MSPSQRLALIVPFMFLMLVSGLVCTNFENFIAILGGFVFFTYGFVGLIDSSYTAATYDRDTNDDNRVIVCSFLALCFTLILTGLLIFA